MKSFLFFPSSLSLIQKGPPVLLNERRYRPFSFVFSFVLARRPLCRFRNKIIVERMNLPSSPLHINSPLPTVGKKIIARNRDRRLN